MKTNEIVQAALITAGHALANDNSAVTDITRLVNNYEATPSKRPFYIYCSATGQKKGMSQLPVFEKRLAASGNDILAMFATYKSREGRPVTAKESKPVKVKAPATETAEAVVVPEVIEAVEVPVVVEDTVAADDSGETPKDRRNRLRREKAAQEKASREAKLAEQAAA